MLHEQLKVIQDLLGVGDKQNLHPMVRKLLQRFEAEQEMMSPAAAEAVKEELERIRTPEMQGGDFATTCNYVEWLMDVPWKKLAQDSYDIGR